MVPVLSLWLPILVSAVFVFIASSVIHMMLRYHSTDYAKIPDENAVADALRKANLADGHYMYPYAGDMKEMNSPEFQEKVKKGPQFHMTISAEGSLAMGKNLVLWFLYCIVIGIFAAYVAGRALEPGAYYLSVFRFVGTVAFCCYAVGGWAQSIWWRQKWSVTAKNTFDGLVYALVTAGTFGWLWPSM